jgi:hypothetical protein
MHPAPTEAQDWKPGDPIPFGSAHKSMFDNSAPAGAPGSSRMITPGTTSGASIPAGGSAGINPVTSAAASAQPNAMENFLNSRSIEWKPGDPVSFGSAHHPAASDKSINGDNNQTPVGGMPSTPISFPLPPVIGAVNTPPQDLSPAPSISGAVAGQGTIPAAMPSNTPGWAPAAPGGQGFSGATGNSLTPSAPDGKKNKAIKNNANSDNSNKAHNKKSGSSGNIFSHALHWMFGGNQ